MNSEQNRTHSKVGPNMHPCWNKHDQSSHDDLLKKNNTALGIERTRESFRTHA